MFQYFVLLFLVFSSAIPSSSQLACPPTPSLRPAQPNLAHEKDMGMKGGGPSSNQTGTQEHVAHISSSPRINVSSINTQSSESSEVQVWRSSIVPLDSFRVLNGQVRKLAVDQQELKLKMDQIPDTSIPGLIQAHNALFAKAGRHRKELDDNRNLLKELQSMHAILQNSFNINFAQTNKNVEIYNKINAAQSKSIDGQATEIDALKKQQAGQKEESKRVAGILDVNFKRHDGLLDVHLKDIAALKVQQVQTQATLTACGAKVGQHDSSIQELKEAHAQQTKRLLELNPERVVGQTSKADKAVQSMTSDFNKYKLEVAEKFAQQEKCIEDQKQKIAQLEKKVAQNRLNMQRCAGGCGALVVVASYVAHWYK